MARARLFVGSGTEVVVQAIVPACRTILDRLGRWPDDLWVLAADSDRRAGHRMHDADLPPDRVTYVPLSIQQVKDALARSRDEFKDAWRAEWLPIVRSAPDNGACMVPSLGRLMFRAARPAILRALRGVERRLGDGGAPDIYFVMNPLSGTSRGSIFDLPVMLRSVWPDARIHGLLVYPVDVESMDPRVSRIYQTNFVEALRILDHYTSERSWDVWDDAKGGWETREGRLLDTVFAFDATYGNRRLGRGDSSALHLEGGLGELLRHVADLLADIGTNDRLADWLLGRLADVGLHHATGEVAGHRTACAAVHVARVQVETDRLRQALVERAVARILAPFAVQVEERQALAGPDFI
ncbi:MAG: hypothetical protein AMXMBFR64_13410 [Myxococcales bacterium]